MVRSFLIDDFFLLILHLHRNHNQEFDRYEYDDVEFVRESKDEFFLNHISDDFIHTICFI